ncbi:DUF6248 family natural product biosynthesis protein [Streptomyces sp. SYSU K217416]
MRSHASPSPMSEEEGAWVRANAWTKGLRRIEDDPRGFHRWCSCERGICHPAAPATTTSASAPTAHASTRTPAPSPTVAASSSP